MDLAIGISFLVALSGVVLYVVTTHAKAMEVGRLMFACGLLAGLLRVAGEASLHIR